ncbi:hypothetical protein GXW82_01950 [Streptacidiphilus sp. 4-A2]|nr:hypothetical protein [Streptacidiphilus sp. 4-A2]
MAHTLARLFTVGAMAGAVAVAGIGAASAKTNIDLEVRPHTQHVGQWFSVQGSGRTDSAEWEKFCVQERYGNKGAWQTVWCGKTSDSTAQSASGYGWVRAGQRGTLELRGVLEGVQTAKGGRTWVDAESSPVSVSIVR